MTRSLRFAAVAIALLGFSITLAADAPDDDAAAHKVTIHHLKYDPAKVTIKPGETVLWINKDDNDHTVIARDGSFASENLTAGDKFRHTFKDKGEFAYYCKYHPRMKGVVLVKD